MQTPILAMVAVIYGLSAYIDGWRFIKRWNYYLDRKFLLIHTYISVFIPELFLPLRDKNMRRDFIKVSVRSRY